MKQTPIRVTKPIEFKPIDYTVGYSEGFPIIHTLSIQEQKDIIAAGFTKKK